MAIDVIDRIADNKYVQQIVKYSAGAIAIAFSIGWTIFGWFTAPFRWIADTFVIRAVYTIYFWAKTKVYGALGWKVL